MSGHEGLNWSGTMKTTIPKTRRYTKTEATFSHVCTRVSFLNADLFIFFNFFPLSFPFLSFFLSFSPAYDQIRRSSATEYTCTAASSNETGISNRIGRRGRRYRFVRSTCARRGRFLRNDQEIMARFR